MLLFQNSWTQDVVKSLIGDPCPAKRTPSAYASDGRSRAAGVSRPTAGLQAGTAGKRSDAAPWMARQARISKGVGVRAFAERHARAGRNRSPAKDAMPKAGEIVMQEREKTFGGAAGAHVRADLCLETSYKPTGRRNHGGLLF